MKTRKREEVKKRRREDFRVENKMIVSSQAVVPVDV